MAFRPTVQLPSFNGVGAGQTATLEVPLGWTYHRFLLTYSGVTLSEMNEIRVVLNGQPIRRYVGGSARLDAMNQYTGRDGASGVLVIDFDRPYLLNREAREYTALGTGFNSNQDNGVQPENLTLEIDIDGAATAPALSCKAVRSARSLLGEIVHVNEFNYNAGAAGEFEIADLPRPAGWKANRIFIWNGNINSVELKRDGYQLFKRTPAENDLLQDDGIRVPQTGLFVVDPSEEGYGADPLVIERSQVSDFRIIADLSSSGAIPVTMEYLGPFRT